LNILPKEKERAFFSHCEKRQTTTKKQQKELNKSTLKEEMEECWGLYSLQAKSVGLDLERGLAEKDP